MNRDDVAKEYTLDRYGHVTDPGKFELEHWSTVALWDVVMNGFSDETFYMYDDEPPYDIFFVDDDGEFIKKYELSEDTFAIILHCSEQGFVTADWRTELAYSSFVSELLPDEELSDE